MFGDRAVFVCVPTDHANAVRSFLYPFPTRMFDQVTGPARKLAAVELGNCFHRIRSPVAGADLTARLVVLRLRIPASPHIIGCSNPFASRTELKWQPSD